MTRIKAIVFDMDGVLIDAKEWHYQALNRALSLFGFAISRYDHLVTYDGLPTNKKLQILTSDHGFPRGLHRFVNELKQQYTLELICTQCRPEFVHEYALSKLRSEGYVLAVASNSIRRTVELMMERANLTQYLDFMLSNQDIAKPKPDPEIYTTAMARAGATPDECVVIEDNHHGIEAATRAGAHVLRVTSVADVNYARIRSFIDSLEESSAATDAQTTRKAA
ncbi:MAG: HAD-IA family hydrolase [Pirellulales bacterium]